MSNWIWCTFPKFHLANPTHFCAIYEKPEGGSKWTPPAWRGLRYMYLRMGQFCNFIFDHRSPGKFWCVRTQWSQIKPLKQILKKFRAGKIDLFAEQKCDFWTNLAPAARNDVTKICKNLCWYTHILTTNWHHLNPFAPFHIHETRANIVRVQG